MSGTAEAACLDARAVRWVHPEEPARGAAGRGWFNARTRTHEAPTEEAQAAIGQFVCEGLTQKHLSMADLLESRREAKDA